MIIEAYNNYGASSPSSKVSMMQVRYIVSCHPYLDIVFSQVNFNSILFIIKLKISLMCSCGTKGANTFDAGKAQQQFLTGLNPQQQE